MCLDLFAAAWYFNAMVLFCKYANDPSHIAFTDGKRDDDRLFVKMVSFAVASAYVRYDISVYF